MSTTVSIDLKTMTSIFLAIAIRIIFIPTPSKNVGILGFGR